MKGAFHNFCYCYMAVRAIYTCGNCLIPVRYVYLKRCLRVCVVGQLSNYSTPQFFFWDQLDQNCCCKLDLSLTVDVDKLPLCRCYIPTSILHMAAIAPPKGAIDVFNTSNICLRLHTGIRSHFAINNELFLRICTCLGWALCFCSAFLKTTYLCWAHFVIINIIQQIYTRGNLTKVSLKFCFSLIIC